jgi:2-C-methyl-D-erythritol 4-phosphate cytidylyltransferase
MTTAAIVVAAGRGDRFGNRDKIMTPLCGRPMLAWSLDTIQAVSGVRDIVIVVADHTEATVRDLLAREHWPKVLMTVLGAAQRHQSVLAGLRVLPDDIDTVVIHDAARPLATPGQFAECIAAARTHGAAIAATPVTDTLKRVTPDGQISETIDRRALWAAQTPQAFDLARLRDAFARVGTSHTAITDEAMLFEKVGWPVHIVPGSRENVKVTVAEDVALAEHLLRQRLEES